MVGIAREELSVRCPECSELCSLECILGPSRGFDDKGIRIYQYCKNCFIIYFLDLDGRLNAINQKEKIVHDIFEKEKATIEIYQDVVLLKESEMKILAARLSKKENVTPAAKFFLMIAFFEAKRIRRKAEMIIVDLEKRKKEYLKGLAQDFLDRDNN